MRNTKLTALEQSIRHEAEELRDFLEPRIRLWEAVDRLPERTWNSLYRCEALADAAEQAGNPSAMMIVWETVGAEVKGLILRAVGRGRR